MSEETIIRFCAPTLAGIKTGSLFSAFFPSEDEMTEEIRGFNRRLRSKGIIFVPMKYDAESGRGLVYVFRPVRLKNDLSCPACRQLLQKFGYTCGDLGGCLRDLIFRVRDGKDFPHEIGLFLSYPPDDVKEFIRRRAAGAKCTGTWKVYGDEDQARDTFEKYRRCMECCAKEHACGVSLENMTVST